MSLFRVLLTILAIVFITETAVMLFLLTFLPSHIPAAFAVLLDAAFMTLISAPLLWWTIARPFRREAIIEHAKAESIAGAATEGIITFGEKGIIESINPPAGEIFGLGEQEAVGESLAILIPGVLGPERAEVACQALASGSSQLIGRTTELSGRRKDGRSVPLALSVTAVRVAGRWLYTAIVRDLTTLRRAEKERQARAIQQAVMVRQGQRALVCDDLSQLLQETAECVVNTLDLQHCLILELLPDGETLVPRAGVGWSRRLLDESVWSVSKNSPSAGSIMRDEPLIVDNYCLEQRYDGPDLLRYHGITSGMSVLIRHGERPFGVLGAYSATPRLFRDDEVHFLDDLALVITLAMQRKAAELKQHERETLRAEHLATVAQMAAGVAHELRNPLTSIKMLVQAGRENESAIVPPEDLRYIEQEIRRMERCLQSYLDFARPRKPEHRMVDLGDLVELTLALIEPRAVQQQVELRFARPATPVSVEADFDQIQQVLINLAFNALDAMPLQGRLDMEIRVEGQDTAIVTVADTGPGIAPAMLSRLFQPFATNKETGTGLGLVTSRRIAEDHGGSLRSIERPDGGARFELRLPACFAAANTTRDQG
jgi:PAS domain S-box-containing protein